MLVIFLFSLSFFFFLVFLNFTTLLVSINQRRIKTKLGIEPILVYMLIYIVNMTVTKMVFKLSIWVVFFNTILLLASIFLARKIKIIGVTGGISCGKSTLCHFFEEFFKLPVVSADQVSRDIMRPGQPAYNEVLKIFGKDFLLPNGEFDRPKLGQVIFASKEKKRMLNRITHGPILKKIIIDSLGHLFKRGSPIVVLEVPLLFETFWLQFVCYPIIVIYMGDKEKWIKTLCQRDGINEEQANAKINAQMNIANKIKKAEFSLDNSGTKEELFKKLLDHLPDYFNFPPK